MPPPGPPGPGHAPVPEAARSGHAAAYQILDHLRCSAVPEAGRKDKGGATLYDEHQQNTAEAGAVLDEVPLGWAHSPLHDCGPWSARSADSHRCDFRRRADERPKAKRYFPTPTFTFSFRLAQAQLDACKSNAALKVTVGFRRTH